MHAHPVKDASPDSYKFCSPLFSDFTSLDLGTGLALDSTVYSYHCRTTVATPVAAVVASRARQALVDHDSQYFLHFFGFQVPS